MNLSWCSERAISIITSTASIIENNGLSLQADQILFDAMRIYALSCHTLKWEGADGTLRNTPEWKTEENLEMIRLAVRSIASNPKNVGKILEDLFINATNG